MARVGLVLGSDSDLPRFRRAIELLERLKIDYELNLISAHRDPDRVAKYAREAESRGLEVLVAGAGSAAHLAGALAAGSLLPVIGVPLGGSALAGVDALYATVQMPPGVPVATVGIDQAENGALLAAQILARKDPELRLLLAEERERRRQDLREKDRRLGEMGYKSYLGDETEG